MEKPDNLRGIVEFVAAVDAGSFSAASRKLDVSVAHVSRAVANLEADLGVQLLKRNSRSSALTDHGEVFYRKCRDVLGALDEARDSVRDAKRMRGRIRITMGGYYAETVLAPLVGKFAALHPSLSVDLEMTLRNVRLVEDDIDLAVRGGPLPSSSLVARRLCGFPMLTVCAPEFLSNAPAAPSDIDPAVCFVLHERAWPFSRGGEATTLQPRGRIKSASGALLVQAAIEGAGIAQVPSYFCDEAIQAGLLRQILPDWGSGEMEFFLLYPEQRHLPARVRALMSFLIEGAANAQRRI